MFNQPKPYFPYVICVLTPIAYLIQAADIQIEAY